MLSFLRKQESRDFTDCCFIKICLDLLRRYIISAYLSEMPNLFSRKGDFIFIEFMKTTVPK